MENINVAEKAVGSIPMGPIPGAEARIARAVAEETAKVAANNTARFITATSHAIRSYMSTKFIERRPTIGRAGHEGLNPSAKYGVTRWAVASASTDKATIAKFNGFDSFLKAISTEATARLAEAKAGGGMGEIAETTANEAAEIAARCTAEEVDDAETANAATEKAIKAAVAKCILSANRAAEVIRITKAVTGEETPNVSATRVAAVKTASAFAGVVFTRAACQEAWNRLGEAQHGIEHDVARKTFKQIAKMVQIFRRAERKAHAEEKAARASGEDFGPPAAALPRRRKARAEEKAARASGEDFGPPAAALPRRRKTRAEEKAARASGEDFEPPAAALPRRRKARAEEKAARASGEDFGPPAAALPRRRKARAEEKAARASGEDFGPPAAALPRRRKARAEEKAARASGEDFGPPAAALPRKQTLPRSLVRRQVRGRYKRLHK